MNAGKFFLLVVLGLFLTTSAYAKDLKIGYVELGGVFNNYQKTKAYDEKLQKESQDVQKQMEDMLKKIRDDEGKLALLKEDEKKKLQASIDKQKMSLMDLQKQKRTELAQKFEDMKKEILLEIEKVVTEIANKEGYSFIFNDTVMLYADKDANLTVKVLKALNDGYSSKK